jgi:hypothetical protein
MREKPEYSLAILSKLHEEHTKIHRDKDPGKKQTKQAEKQPKKGQKVSGKWNSA